MEDFSYISQAVLHSLHLTEKLDPEILLFYSKLSSSWPTYRYRFSSVSNLKERNEGKLIFLTFFNEFYAFYSERKEVLGSISQAYFHRAADTQMCVVLVIAHVEKLSIP